MLQRTNDLPVPTLGNLAILLRHSEQWPKGFHWDFNNPANCAMGLMDRVWGKEGEELRYSLPHKDERALFYRGVTLNIFFGHVTPERVAKRIDKYLAARSEEGS